MNKTESNIKRGFQLPSLHEYTQVTTTLKLEQLYSHERNSDFTSRLYSQQVRNQMIAERAQKNKELSLPKTASSDRPIESNHLLKPNNSGLCLVNCRQARTTYMGYSNSLALPDASHMCANGHYTSVSHDT